MMSFLLPQEDLGCVAFMQRLTQANLARYIIFLYSRCTGKNMLIEGLQRAEKAWMVDRQSLGREVESIIIFSSA